LKPFFNHKNILKVYEDIPEVLSFEILYVSIIMEIFFRSDDNAILL